MPTRNWKHVLITGASAGIGEEYARQLAQRCGRLTLVARREDRLHALAGDLREHCEVEVLAADLGNPVGLAAVVELTRQRDPVDLLVNNAGFSTLGPFAASDLDAELEMVRLHLDASMALCRAVLPGMRDSGAGAIINVASVAAFLPLPGVATYAATKAFLASFSQALQRELADASVSVQCLCPGYTRTEIHSRDSFSGFDSSRVPEEMWMEAGEVVAESLAALERGDTLVVPGAQNRALVREALAALQAELAD